MPNEEIGKLNVVVNLDSTGFQNGISQLNRQMKLVQSEFQLATAKLGNFENSTDKLKLQADALTKQIEIQRQKVAALEQAYQKSVETKGADAKATQDLAIKLNKAQAELAKMENDLKKTTEELEKQTSVWYKLSQATKDAGEKMKSAGEKLSDIGKSLSTHVTAPLAAAGAGLVKLGSDFDEAYDKIRIGTGATGEALAGLQEAFRNVAKEVPNSFDEISTAIADLNTRLDLTGPDLQNLAVQMLNLSRVTGTDLSSNIESAAQAFRAFNLDTKDYGASLDYVFKVSQSTGIGIDRLLSILKTSSPALQQLGLDFQSAATLVGQLEKAGVNVEQAMTGLNRAIANMAKEGIKDANKAVSELFNRIKNAPNDMKATEMAVEIFGTKAGPTLAKAIREGKMSFDELMNSLKSNSESINKVANETDDWAEKFAKLKNQLLLALEPLAGQLFDAINNLVPHIQKFADWIGQLAQKFANLSPQQQEMVLKIALMVAAIGPALTVIGKLISTVGTAAKAFSTISMAIANAGGIMAALTSPVSIAIGAITALIAIGVLLYKNWDSISAWLKETWASISDTAQRVWNGLTQFFANLWEGMKNFFAQWGPVILAVIAPFIGIPLVIQQNWGQISAWLSNTWNNIASTASRLWQNIKNAIMAPIENLISWLKMQWLMQLTFEDSIFNQIRSQASAMWNGIKEAIMAPINAVRSGLSAAWSAISAAASTAWSAIRNTASSIWSGIRTAITSPIDSLRSLLSSAWGSITSSAYNAWNSLRNTAASVWNSIKTAITTPINNLRSALSGTWSSIESSASSAWNSLRNTASSLWNSIKTTITSPMTSLPKQLSSIWSSITSSASSAWNSLRNTASNIFSRIRDTILAPFRNLHIPLPHLSVSVSYKSIAGIKIPVPDFDIRWYATGGIFNRPSVIGVGEKGPEAVIPIDRLKDLLGDVGQKQITINVYTNAADRIVRELRYQLGGGL